MEAKYYIKRDAVRHPCCWDTAIVRPKEIEDNNVPEMFDYVMVCDCLDIDAQMICDALNAFYGKGKAN